MRRTAMLWEVFVRRFEEAFEQYEKHRLTGEEAGELLGMSGRNFRRLCVRYEEDGVEGLRDRRIGKVSPRRAPERELELTRYEQASMACVAVLAQGQNEATTHDGRFLGSICRACS